MANEYYETLGVPPDADAKDIKRAYRKIALANHPDQNPDDPEAEQRFRAASQAYEVLSNAEKRDLYDRHGEAGVSGQGPSMHDVDLNDIFGSFGDIFSGMFGGFGRSNRRSERTKGADLRIRMSVSWNQVIEGDQRTIEVKRHGVCSTCAGKRSVSGKPAQRCGVCQGTGQVVQQQGHFVLSGQCARCGGRGEVIADPCPPCAGAGRVVTTGQVKVEIPAGVESGMQLRIRGEGELSDPSLPRGDLLVVFEAEDPPDGMERDGSDLHCLLPVALPGAVLGDTLAVLGARGEVQVKLKAGAQEGDQVTVRGAGLPHVRDGRHGDLICHVQLAVPKRIGRKAAKLWAELKALDD
jgi:molecular chaperone DnaJ